MFYDVVIIGGGTAGCACAYIAAKLGLKTLLIEKENYLGGTMTGGLVVPVMKSGDNQINTDFYNSLIIKMKEANAQITFQDNPGWFDPIILKNVLYNMLKNMGVNIVLNANIEEINISNNKIDGIKISTSILSAYNDTIHTNNMNADNSRILSVYIGSKYVVDATGNLYFSKKINAKFLENYNEYPPVSLRFLMSGINSDIFGKWLLEYDKDRNVTVVENIDNSTYLSCAYTWDTDKNWALAPLFEDATAKNIIKNTDRNYFQIFSVAKRPDTIAFNCPRILNKINPYNDEDLKSAYKEGLEIINRLSNFCKEYFPGFENAYVSHVAEKIGIRAANRIKGKYIYTIDDLRNGKKFKNPVVISNYPVDIHSREKNTSLLEINEEYQLPIESLMSADYENLFVAGRGLSADELAQGALRVQASCFSMGEGVAKYIYNKLTSS